MMASFFDILARGNTDSFITVLIFIIIIAVKVVGGIVKSVKENQDAQKEQAQREKIRQYARQEGKPKYKSAEQWKTGKAKYESSQSLEHTRPVSQEGETAIDRALRAKRELLEKQRLAQQQAQYKMARRERNDQQRRREYLAKKRKERQKQQKLIQEQKRQLLAQKQKAQQIAAMKKKRYGEDEVYQDGVSIDSYQLADMDIGSIRNVIVASEILSKPIALRQAGERVF